MRKLFLLLLTLAVLMTACSRESDIKPDADMNDTRFVVMVLRARPDSLAKFVDSIAKLDSVIQDDTVGFTVNDTVYLLGYKYKKNQEIRKYTWQIDSKTQVFAARNAEIFPITFADSGSFRTLMLAADNNNVVDTAGKHQVLHIVNDPPTVSSLRDTVWARNAAPGRVPLRAQDLFGRVERIRVDFDGNGSFDSTFAYTAADTVWASVPQVVAAMDSLGNQKVVIQAEDDDGQLANDTLVLHFNRLPVLSLDYPFDSSRVSIFERFAFYYHATDSDNESAVRYYLRVGKSPDAAGTVPVLTNKSLIMSASPEKSFELLTKELTWTVNDSLASFLRGRLYWQVWCTDGFDTVFTETHSFFFGDLSQKYGRVQGVAQMQGQSQHDGIRMTLEQLTTGNRYFARTSSTGAYSFADVEPGHYLLNAEDTVGLGYPSAGVPDLYVEVGDLVRPDTIWLTDTQKPKIYLDAAPPDTIKTRDSVEVRWFVGDFGSQVKSGDVHITLGGVDYSASKAAEGRIWKVNLPAVKDGAEVVRIWAVDGAGNVSDTLKFSWIVNAKTVVLTVNDKPAATVNATGALQFKATIANDNPTVTEVLWQWNCQGTDYSETTDLSGGLSEFVFNLPLAHACRVVGQNYTMYMTASDASGLPLRASAKFGFKADDAPSVIFIKPAQDTVVSIKDEIDVLVEGLDKTGNLNPLLSYDYTCSAAGLTECPADGVNSLSGKATWNTAGSRAVTVVVTEGAITGSATLNVTVKLDEPTVRIRYTDSLSVVVNHTQTLTAVAFDTLGTIANYDWRCGTLSALPGTWTADDATFTVTAPASANAGYGCEVRVTDDDGNTAMATTKLPVIQAAPKVSVAVANATVTLKDTLRLQALASDTLGGSIVAARWSCAAPADIGDYWIWPSNGKIDTIAIAPDTAASPWLCVVEVEDDDGNTARDTTVFTVLQDPPQVTVVNEQLTRTIKDQVVLDAYATDAYGRITKYEWSCGAAGVAGNGNWIVSVGSPRYTYTLPATADPGYLCVIRVTDDDGQTAKDTTHINLLQDAPVVTVSPPTLVVGIGLNITLSATATDGLGQIVKREWSCGGAGVGGVSGWLTVSDFNSTWQAPQSTVSPYYCVARATDDDGNQGRDTITVTLTSERPSIAVTQEVIYVRAGDPFEAGVSYLGPWPAQPTTYWQCGASPTYELPAPASTIVIGGDWTLAGADIQCVVRAQIDANNPVYDTLQVKVIKTAPVGVLSSVDSAFLWSGDVAVPDANKYFYSAAFNGSSSTPGTLGVTPSQYQFWWNFSNFESAYWFQSNTNGSIDTSIYQFNEAFIRLKSEGSVTMQLDFRDSTPPAGETDPAYLSEFKYRHAAALVSKTVVFYRAWKNQMAGDTVAAYTTSPVLARMVYNNGAPVVAYVDGSGIGRAKTIASNGVASEIGNGFGAVSGSLRLASDANADLYVAYVNAAGQVEVRSSTGGTGAWSTALGGAQGSSVSKVVLGVDVVNHRPVVAYRTTSSTMKVIAYNGSSWVDLGFPGGTAGTLARTIDLAVSSNGTLGVVFVGTGTDFKVYYRQWNLSGSTYSRVGADGAFETPWNSGDTALACTFKNASDFALVVPDRDNNGNPQVRLRSGGSWSSVGSVFGQRIGGFSSIVFADDGRPVVAMDDRIWADQAQIHVWKYNGSKWVMLGENQLPYFGKTFRDSKGYYLRGSAPTLALGGGSIYLGMQAMEMAVSAGQVLGARNNGPLVQKYIGP